MGAKLWLSTKKQMGEEVNGTPARKRGEENGAGVKRHR